MKIEVASLYDIESYNDDKCNKEHIQMCKPIVDLNLASQTRFRHEPKIYSLAHQRWDTRVEKKIYNKGSVQQECQR